jgi:predicted nucleic-acid-binding protein
MSIEQLLQNEIKESIRWIEIEKDESTYKRNLKKRVELINWVLESMKNSKTDICSVIETRMNEIIYKINKTDSIFEADPLDNELRILDCILYQVYSNKIKRFEMK